MLLSLTASWFMLLSSVGLPLGLFAAETLACCSLSKEADTLTLSVQWARASGSFPTLKHIVLHLFFWSFSMGPGQK